MALRSSYPAAALEWLLARPKAFVLNLGASPGFCNRLGNDGHAVISVDKDPEKAATAAPRQPDSALLVANAESLPFEPCVFDAVTAMQNLHTFAPGMVLSEAARVLKPGGVLAVTYLTRDNSVPWVRRMVAVVQSALPDAMRGDYGDASVSALMESKYFPRVDHRDFRVWVPCSRTALVDMALGSRGAAELPAEERAALAAEVGAIYDQAAKAPDPLLLPYRLGCWRAWVDHSELTASIEGSPDGLRITF